jgi:ferredoxin
MEMRVWIDQDLWTGDGLCVDHCPEVFVLLGDGISYVHFDGWLGDDPGQEDSVLTVVPAQVRGVVDAAELCPGERIFIEVEDAAAVAR